MEEKKKITLKVAGMKCAGCVYTVKNIISSVNGVIDVDVNLNTEKAHIIYDPKRFSLDDAKKAVANFGYKIVEREGEKEESLWKIILGIITGLILMVIMFLPFHFHKHIISLIISSPAFFIIAFPIFFDGLKSLKSKRLTMTLMYTIGISSAYIAGILNIFNIIEESMFFESSIFLATFLTLGRYLESKAKKKAVSSIKKITELIPENVILVKDGRESETEIKNISVNDVLLVKTGASIPLDGEIIDGETFVNESMITGESIPVYKKKGDKVTGGTINLTNPIKLKVEKIGEDTFLSKIIKFIEEGQMKKPRLQNLADKIVQFFIPFILTISIITFIYWFVIKNYPLQFALVRFISVIVIACPCALGLAIPTATTVGIGKGAENGILIRNGEVFEKSEKLSKLFLDKTGTLTEGNFKIDSVSPYEMEKEEFLKIISSLERYFSHPISESILNFYGKNNFYDLKEVKLLEGKGIAGILDGKEILIGNEELFIEKNILEDELRKNIKENFKKGDIKIFLAVNNKFKGFLTLQDRVKEDARYSISEIKKMNIKTVIISGDKEENTERIAKEIGVDFFFANVLPNEKLKIVSDSQEKGDVVAFVGDGINDAPALAIADIGIALGSGTDIAIETGEIVLVKNRIIDILNSIILSKAVMKKIRQNLFWAFFYNIILIPVASGLFYERFKITLRPEMSGFAMALSSFSVISFSLLLKRLKLKKVVKNQ